MNELQLYNKLASVNMSWEELKDFIFKASFISEEDRIRISFESIAGETVPSKLRELILKYKRHGYLTHLIEVSEKVFPNLEW